LGVGRELRRRRDEADDDLSELLGDIDTAPTDDPESDRPTEDLQLRLWEDDRTAA
jgi:hypothetical protein